MRDLEHGGDAGATSDHADVLLHVRLVLDLRHRALHGKLCTPLIRKATCKTVRKEVEQSLCKLFMEGQRYGEGRGKTEKRRAEAES